MTVKVTTFRQDFREFADETAYPDPAIQFWLSIADKLLTTRWEDFRDHGIELFAAHHLALQQQNLDAAKVGNVPGISKGMVSNQSVDSVSEAYDTASAREENAGHWNLTIYGQQYVRLARIVGMGPIQL